MPRVTHDSTGTNADAPPALGRGDDLVAGHERVADQRSKYADAVPSIIARSVPQMPDEARRQARPSLAPASGSGSFGSSFNGPTAAPAARCQGAR